MSRTLVIAECGSSWVFGSDPKANAFSMIEAAKECDADVAKFQWTSGPVKMAARRGHPEWAENYSKYLTYNFDFLEAFKAHCDKVGIEFMVTAYLIEDIAKIAPLVKRFKVSAFESWWEEFKEAHPIGSQRIVSYNNKPRCLPDENWHNLWCVSKYPTEISELSLGSLKPEPINNLELCYPLYDGLSDHTTSVLTGALAVAMGGTIVEKHVRLWNTPKDNPDYPHSLVAEPSGDEYSFTKYVSNIREAERAL